MCSVFEIRTFVFFVFFAFCKDNIEGQIDILQEIDNSYESEADRTTYLDGPKLLLCDYCRKEYVIPSYPI
jgi:hypothetical protein